MKNMKLWQIALLSMAAAAAANLVLLLVLKAALPLPDGFPPLQPGAVVIFSLIGTGLSAAVYALVRRLSAKTNTTFRLVAGIALVISILPNIALMLNPVAAPFPGGSALAFGVLIVFHISAALISVGLLTTAPEKA